MTPAGAGGLLLSGIVAGAVLAPVLTPHNPSHQFDYPNAPPMRVRVLREDGSFGRPFVYPLVLVDRLERKYEEDRQRPVAVDWFSHGVVASIDESGGPWLPLGADPLGRDVFARLAYGARLSLGVACIATLGALALGMLIGAPAGLFGGRTEGALMMLADFVLVLPAIYVVLALRAAMPLVLTVPQVFVALTLILAAAGWPISARGIRTIVSGERRKEYAEAARAAGAGTLRLLLRHLLPATSGFLRTMMTMMVPAFVLSEATVSLVGLGFPAPAASWGVMLRDAADGGAFTDAPWLLAPAAAIVLTVLALQLITTERGSDTSISGTFS